MATGEYIEIIDNEIEVYVRPNEIIDLYPVTTTEVIYLDD